MNLAGPVLLRVTRSKWAWLALLGWSSVAVGGALWNRWRGGAHGADHALVDWFADLCLPFLVLGLVTRVLGGKSLARSGVATVLLGASPGRVARVTATTSVILSSATGGVLAALVAVLAHGGSDPPVGRDLIVSGGIGALAAAAYAGLFLFGASFGARGFARSVLLIADWIVGSGRGTAAMFTPRAHLRALLGGVAPHDVPPRASYAWLLGIAVVGGVLAVFRASRAEWKLPKR